eukprot:TRINITY_DN47778_c0_g1_i1.p1 TRINITY_DN47778_c0_g1~~TRINITY_DN47778_c0_g1_i1.p1  ORF type:complete len:366 (-),score=83.11 TRINITY_DN47778_c0_g1_i1:184-1281(-)
MIGLVFRALGMGGICDATGIMVLGGSALAICALCGFWRCGGCRMRDCACIKRFMRATGADKFDDFEMLLVIHESSFTSTKAKMITCVRIKAGSQVVTTGEHGKGIFQETLNVFVEQGVSEIIVDLMDARQKKVLGTLSLDPVKDLIEGKILGEEHMFTLKQKSKDILNPKLKMSIHLDWGEDLETGLLSDMTGLEVSKETDMLIRSQLQKVAKTQSPQVDSADPGGESPAAPGKDLKEMSKLELMAQGCAGPLDMFGSWGRSSTVWAVVRGPPHGKKYTLCIYKDEKSMKKGDSPTSEIPLLKVLSVQPDPARSEVFILNYVDANKVKKRDVFRRVDRGRDVWVEMLTILITMVREEKEAKDKMK